MKSANDRVGSLIENMCNLMCKVQETQKKLNAAKQMLEQASHHNENINRLLDRCAADMKLSEKMVQHVGNNVEAMIQTQAA